MTSAQQRLGLSCPKEGQFYVCENSNLRFIGCCTVDPCTDERGGECPTDSLRTSSFSSDSYNKIGQQSCFSPEDESIWYTCKADTHNPVPFMGCCKGNPCSAAGCKSDDLYPARLSDNPDKAEVFLSDSTSTATPSADSGTSFPTGAVVGAVLGGVAVISILIIAFIMYRRGLLGKKRKTEKEADESTNLYNPSFQGQYSPGLASNWPGSQPNSPGLNYMPYNNNQTYHDNLSVATTEWNSDSRHVSQVSGMSWDAVTANAGRKHYSQLSQGPPAMELEGTTAVPAQAYQGTGGQYTSELDGRTNELPKVVVELPATDRR